MSIWSVFNWFLVERFSDTISFIVVIGISGNELGKCGKLVRVDVFFGWALWECLISGMALRDFDFDAALKSLIELVDNKLTKDNEETEVSNFF